MHYKRPHLGQGVPYDESSPPPLSPSHMVVQIILANQQTTPQGPYFAMGGGGEMLHYRYADTVYVSCT